MTALPIIFTSEIECDESTIRTITFPFEDSAGVAPTPGSFVWSSIKCTYIEQISGDPINSRDGQDINGVNGGSWNDATGEFRLVLTVADTSITNLNVPAGLNQVNRLVISFAGTLDGAPYQQHAHVRIILRNRRLLPLA